MSLVFGTCLTGTGQARTVWVRPEQQTELLAVQAGPVSSWLAGFWDQADRDRSVQTGPGQAGPASKSPGKAGAARKFFTPGFLYRPDRERSSRNGSAQGGPASKSPGQATQRASLVLAGFFDRSGQNGLGQA